MNDVLYQHVYSNLHYQQDEVLEKFVDTLKAEYKQSLLAVIFYGSCMRTSEYKDAMLDFYVIVDNYHSAYSNRWYSIANKILPPNVFYLQVTLGDQTYRSKYAVVSKSALSYAVEKSFHPYFWARFSQPMSYIYVKNNDIREWVADTQRTAATTFLQSVIKNVEGQISSETLWITGLKLTYSSELRAESKQRAEMIYQDGKEYFDGITECLYAEKLTQLSINNKNIFATIKWKARKFLGKLLSILRLMKATTTFVNGVDYIAWKIERHTGEQVIVNEKLRRYPLIFCWPLVFKLYIQRKIH
ncbi:MAG: hypothetical protein AB8C40_00880 [Gammaproteobacteria bacterium]